MSVTIVLTPEQVQSVIDQSGVVPPPVTGSVTLNNPASPVPKVYNFAPIAVPDKGWEKNWNIMLAQFASPLDASLCAAYLRASNVAGNNIVAASDGRVSYGQKTQIINERAGYIDCAKIREQAPDVWAMQLTYEKDGTLQKCYVGLPHPDTN